MTCFSLVALTLPYYPDIGCHPQIASQIIFFSHAAVTPRFMRYQHSLVSFLQTLLFACSTQSMLHYSELALSATSMPCYSPQMRYTPPN